MKQKINKNEIIETEREEGLIWGLLKILVRGKEICKDAEEEKKNRVFKTLPRFIPDKKHSNATKAPSNEVVDIKYRWKRL